MNRAALRGAAAALTYPPESARMPPVNRKPEPPSPPTGEPAQAINSRLMGWVDRRLIVAILLCGVGFLGWSFWHLKSQKVWFDYIEKQCRSMQSTLDHPPVGYDPTDLAQRVKFLMGYYEGHSGSLKGSSYEPIARQHYQQTLTNALALFRILTTNDLGGDPRVWVKKYEFER